jgi:hypothetical protein
VRPFLGRPKHGFYRIAPDLVLGRRPEITKTEVKAWPQPLMKLEPRNGHDRKRDARKSLRGELISVASIPKSTPFPTDEPGMYCRKSKSIPMLPTAASFNVWLTRSPGLNPNGLSWACTGRAIKPVANAKSKTQWRHSGHLISSG